MTDEDPSRHVAAGYRVLRRIRRSPDATIYHAVRDEDGAQVALKVFRSAVPGDTELAMLNRLPQHRHLARALGSGRGRDGRPYLATVFHPDGSYADLLAQSGPMPVDEAVRVGQAIAEALHAAHGAGLIHRDVTPSNILRGSDGPVLTDFGVAAAPAELAGTVALDRLTPPHAAPEALLRQAQDARSDVYSLASTLWTLLAGHAPFAAAGDRSPDPFEYREHALRHPLPPVPRPDVPEWLQATLFRAMAKSPEDRYPSAEAFATALRDRKETFPSSDAVTPPPASPASPPVPPPSPVTEPATAAIAESATAAIETAAAPIIEVPRAGSAPTGGRTAPPRAIRPPETGPARKPTAPTPPHGPVAAPPPVPIDPPASASRAPIPVTGRAAAHIEPAPQSAPTTTPPMPTVALPTKVAAPPKPTAAPPAPPTPAAAPPAPAAALPAPAAALPTSVAAPPTPTAAPPTQIAAPPTPTVARPAPTVTSPTPTAAPPTPTAAPLIPAGLPRVTAAAAPPVPTPALLIPAGVPPVTAAAASAHTQTTRDTYVSVARPDAYAPVPMDDREVTWPGDFDEQGPDGPTSGGRRGTFGIVFAMVSALVVIVVAVTLVVVPMLRDLNKKGTATTAKSPAAPGADTAPTGVTLVDEKVTVRLSWQDPTDGVASFAIVGAATGQSMSTMATAPQGSASVRVNGLNTTVDYCFVVVAMTSVEQAEQSTEVCTHRF